MSMKKSFLSGKGISAKKINTERRINTTASPLHLRMSYKAEENIFLKDPVHKTSRERSFHRNIQNQAEIEYSDYFNVVSPLSTGLKDKEKKSSDERYNLRKKRFSANYETFIIPKEEVKILNKVIF